ncbi:MAG: hypothetical protein L6R40_006979 [Gallowayella cf. fulva]|nr:MAG: hypothetical protein L6R40_006979 [Xanthomendoza cf. fulva]
MTPILPSSHISLSNPSDDTSVAVLETANAEDPPSDQPAAKLHFHEKITADNAQYRGVHPMVALESHNKQLAPLITRAIHALPPSSHGSSFSVRSANGSLLKQKPDFVSVTRGPGMLSSLTTGLNTAKGLAIAWQVPLLGVNHMQAHALTPRLVHALESRSGEHPQPGLPFLSLLVSGGHTMLVHSKALTHHAILATTLDVAIGDAIDKMARQILPADIIQSSGEIMYGRLLERFAFPNGSQEYEYVAPSTRAEEMSSKPSSWGWALAPPLAKTRSGSRSKALEFSFAGLGSAIERVCQTRETVLMLDERVELAREALRVAFEHLASRVLMALQQLGGGHCVGTERIDTVVVSGGVASNSFLRLMYVGASILKNYAANCTRLRSFLDIRGFAHIRLIFPPPSLCTDNAAMIAWTGTEMYKAGFESDLNCRALRKWSIDPDAEDGGILGAQSWKMK